MKSIRIKQIKLILFVGMLFALLASGISYAWLYSSRNLDNLGVIQAPVRLELRAGALESISQFDLGEIDASAEGHCKNYVFGVCGDTGLQYKIQLAYTTNIPFTYQIFKAEQAESERKGQVADVVYRSHDTENSKDYYYYKTDALPYSVLNQNGTVANSTGNYHNLTYGTGYQDASAYSKVQKNAEPMYWQTSSLYSLGGNSESIKIGESSIDYYILTVNWTEAQLQSGEISNNKETDLLYLTIGQEKNGDEKN